MIHVKTEINYGSMLWQLFCLNWTIKFGIEMAPSCLGHGREKTR